MAKELKHIYQSGQEVLMAGTYEVVGVDDEETNAKPEATTCDLHAGVLFPDYDGRAVTWRLISKDLYESTARSAN
ncbi:MAG: hypothetical protein ABI947_02415 [Chloroflexota bacterium]